MDAVHFQGYEIFSAPQSPPLGRLFFNPDRRDICGEAIVLSC
jgi:hypothetical protein